MVLGWKGEKAAAENRTAEERREATRRAINARWDKIPGAEERKREGVKAVSFCMSVCALFIATWALTHLPKLSLEAQRECSVGAGHYAERYQGAWVSGGNIISPRWINASWN